MPSIEKFTINPNLARPPFGTLVAGGKINGYQAFNKFAESSIIPIATERDVWDSVTDLVYLDTEEFLDVVSDSIADTSTGTGARTMSILGLDLNRNFIDETVTLNGLTTVQTVLKYFRVYRMTVRTAGSGESAAGTITVTSVVTAREQAHIVNGNNQTLMSHMTCPAGKVVVGGGFTVSTGAGKSAIVKLLVREPGGVFRISDVIAVTGQFQRNREFGLAGIPEGSDLKVRAIPSDNNTLVTVSYDLIFLDDKLGGG